jgi:cytidylate kinase
MAASVICISRALGAGGEDVARLVSERLGFVYIDEEIIARAAERSGVDHETVADEERRKSLLSNLLASMADGGATFGAPPMTDATWLTPSSDAVRSFIRDAIEEVAAKGKAVIVAHAASHALGSGSGVLRVLITASAETRAARLAEADGVDAAAAEKTVKSSDLARADYLKRFYGVKELPTDYDLVVNTDALTLERAADLLAHAASH